MAYPLTGRDNTGQRPLSIVGLLLIGLRVTAIGISLIISLPLHLLWRLFRLPSPWPRLFLKLVALNSGAIVKTRGKRLKQDVFYVSNHISWFDIPVIAGGTGCTFIAKDDIASWPVIGWLCRTNKTIFEIGRASCRERVGITARVLAMKTKKNTTGMSTH